MYRHICPKSNAIAFKYSIGKNCNTNLAKMCSYNYLYYDTDQNKNKEKLYSEFYMPRRSTGDLFSRMNGSHYPLINPFHRFHTQNGSLYKDPESKAEKTQVKIILFIYSLLINK